MSVTHEQLESAMRIVREGKDAHGLYAVEDALEIVKTAARFNWRQAVALSVSAGLGAGLSTLFFGDVYWILVVVVTISVITAQLLVQTPLLRALFAPPGLSALDVAEASACKIRASR